jgi:hypothetical protein
VLCIRTEGEWRKGALSGRGSTTTSGGGVGRVMLDKTHTSKSTYRRSTYTFVDQRWWNPEVSG